MKTTMKRILSAIMSFALILTMIGNYSIIAQAATVALGTAVGTQGYDTISVNLTAGSFSAVDDDVKNVTNWTLIASGGQTIMNISKGDSQYVTLGLSGVIGPGDTFQIQAAANVFEAGTSPFVPMDVNVIVPIPAAGTATATEGSKDIEITLSSGTFTPSVSTVETVGLWTLGGASAAENSIAGITYTDASTTRAHVTITLANNINIGDTYTISASQGVFVNVTVAPFASPLPVMVQVEVCQIDSTVYTTLDDALNAVPTGGATATTIKLLQDIDYAGGITVANKKIIFDLNGKTLSIDNTTGTGLTVTTGSEIDITYPGAFNVTGYEKGLSASNSIVKVTNVNSNTLHGINAGNSDITVTNDVTSSSYMAVAATGGSMINIGGNVSGANYGVYAQDAGTAITVEGNVSAADNNSCGVHSRDGAAVTVYGNVTATGSNNLGADLGTAGTLTIDGMITAQNYVRLGLVVKTAADITTPTTKAGYFTYTDDISTVWVKVPPVTSGVCEIDGTQYATLDDALVAVSEDQTKTIKLLEDIAYNNGISITGGQNITFNLDGHVLTVSNGAGIGLLVTNGHVGYIGSGAFNVTGTIIGVSANGGSASATVTTATATGDEGTGVSAYNGGDIIVNGSVQGGAHGAAAGMAGSTVVVNGDATGTTAFDGSGATAGSGGHVTINGGTAQGVYYGAYANGSDSLVTINGGDAIGTGPNSFGVHAEIDGTINVDGNTQGTRYGVYSSDDTSVVVTGNAMVTAEVNGWGVNAQSGGTIEIGGNVTANGLSLGAFVTSGGEIIIDGAILASNYISIFDDISETPVYKDGSESSRTIPSTKEGYFTYSAGTSTVWVKGSVMTDAEAVVADKTALTFNSIKNTNVDEDNITANLLLPTTGANGTSISWTSDPAGYISSTGAVTRPDNSEGDKPVILTATVSKGASNDTAVFTLTIKALTMTDAVAVASDKAALTFNSIKNTNTAANNITSNLLLPTTGVNGTSISWTSTSPGIISTTGIVTRPVNGSGNSIVTLQATITKGGASDTVLFVLTVQELPYSGGRSNPGNASSRNSDSYTPPAFRITIEKKPDQPTFAKMDVQSVIDKNGQAVVTITEAQVKALAEAAQTKNTTTDKTADGIGIWVNILFGRTATDITINIEEKAIELLERAKVKLFTISDPLVTFTLDMAAIKELNAQAAGVVTVSVKPVKKLSDAAEKLIGNRPVFDLAMSYKRDGKTLYVNNFGKGTVMLGIAYMPSSSEKTDNIFAVYVNSKGEPQPLINSSYDNKHIIFERNTLSVYGVGYKTPSPAFTDTKIHWAKDDIDFVTSYRIISGTNDTTFAPEMMITRATFLAALGKLSGVDVSGYNQSSFTDVSASSPYMPYIEWAVENKIVQGVGTGKFAPDASITREQMAVMMQNYAKVTNYTLPVAHNAVTFSDDLQISSWAKEAVKDVQQAGIINGKGNNLFDPKGNATRAEASSILRRFIQFVLNTRMTQG